MKKLFTYLVNFTIILFVIFGAFTVSTYALSQKISSYQNSMGELNGVVEKKETIILARARGNVSKIENIEGEKVDEGDLLVTLENPNLINRINSLSEFTDNVSAQTELEVASKEAEQLVVTSPVEGYISEIHYVEGETVNPSDRLFTIFTNENTRVYAELSDSEYKNIQNLKVITAHVERLNQFVELEFLITAPDKKINPDDNSSKVGVYFSLKNKVDGDQLLHNEEVTILLENKERYANRPFEIISRTWSGIVNFQ